MFWTYWKSECANLHTHAHMHVQWPHLFLMIACTVVSCISSFFATELFLILFPLLSSSDFSVCRLVHEGKESVTRTDRVVKSRPDFDKRSQSSRETRNSSSKRSLIMWCVTIPDLISSVMLWSAGVDMNSYSPYCCEHCLTTQLLTAWKFIFTASHKLKSPNILTK